VKYRKHKDLQISEVGIGTYSLSGVYGAKDIEEFKRMINRAFDLGVNFFDTAEAYGDAEKILGDAIKPFRNEVYVATKVGVKGNYKANLSRKYVIAACNDSLKSLQTDYIDLYQVHFSDPNTPVKETVGALEELAEAGKIRYYGVCHLSKDVVEQYCRIGKPFSVLAELSAVARETRENFLPLYREYDLGIIAFSTTGRGLLTGRFREDQRFEAGDIRSIDPLFQRERFESALRISKKLSELGQRYGKTPAQAAVAWTLAQMGVICALTGPSTISHLEENVGGSGWQISKEDLQDLEDFFEEEDNWLIQKQKESIRNILLKPMRDPQKAFTDLIYAIETALSLRLVSEKEVLPIFYQLYGLKKELEREKIKSELEKIQDQLNDLISQ
jgi:aryl-alcohol dehydrogenase-like predicted oxidoreductase